MTRILVTGANGFLGSAVCAALMAEKYDVVAMVRDGADCVRLNQLCPDIVYAKIDPDWAQIETVLANTKPDLVIHTAAAMDGGDDIASAERLVNANILNPIRLLAAAYAQKIKGFITVGTAWQHYGQADYDPVNLYAASKQAFDDMARYYAAAGLPVVSLHMFDTYGPQDPRPKLVNLLCRLAKTGDTMSMSPGEQEIDLIHADDAAAAFVASAKGILDGSLKGFHTFAVSGGQPMPLRQLVTLFENITGKTCAIDWGARPYRPREVMQTWRGNQLAPGWAAKRDLAASLHEIWQAYSKS